MEETNTPRQTWGIIAGVVIVLGLIFAAGYFTSDTGTTTAGNQQSAPPQTTGSGTPSR